MSNQLFVKFVPYNENTLANLINKTIKFSTVFEFNDFNEYGFMPPLHKRARDYQNHNDIAIKIIDILIKESKICTFQQKVLQLAEEKYTPGYSNILKEFFNAGYSLKKMLENDDDPMIEKLLSLYEEYIQKTDSKYLLGSLTYILEEALAYSSVGIFCVSDISVFENDAAQLMFAHYSANLRGLALIYECVNSSAKILPVKYSNSYIAMPQRSDQIIDWYEGEFYISKQTLQLPIKMGKFLQKSLWWGYEHEHRLFSKPSVSFAKDFDIELKAILYTRRLSNKEQLQTLIEINKAFYSNSLIIQEMYVHSINYGGSPYFRVYHPNKKASEPISEFLKKKFPSKFTTTPRLQSIIRKARADDYNDYQLHSKLQWLQYRSDESEDNPNAEYDEPAMNLSEKPKYTNDQWIKILKSADYLVFIAHNKQGKKMCGFIIGKLTKEPLDCNPDRKILLIEDVDFYVEHEIYWESVGSRLLKKIIQVSEKKYGVQKIISHCKDYAKTKHVFLEKNGFSWTSERLIKML